MRRLFFALACLATVSSTAFGWGTKEHIQLTRIAAARILADDNAPAEFKAWIKSAAPGVMDMHAEESWFMNQRMGIFPRGADGIAFWAVMPDVVIQTEPRGQEKKVAPFGVPERLLHYIDLELFLTGDAKREYRNDLSGKPKLQDIPRGMKDPRYVQAGMLPFRVEDCYKKLVEQIKQGRLIDKDGQFPRDEHAQKWAGYLAHYVQDNTQPQHATIDYKSAEYFANKNKAPNVHAQVEYIMADDDVNDHMAIRKEYWPLLVKALNEVEDPIKTEDMWLATNEVAMISYDALPLIGQAAMKAAGQGGTPDKPEGAASDKFDTEVFFRFRGQYLGKEMSVMEMKAHQQAWAVKRVQKLWLKAWNEAHGK